MDDERRADTSKMPTSKFTNPRKCRSQHHVQQCRSDGKRPIVCVCHFTFGLISLLISIVIDPKHVLEIRFCVFSPGQERGLQPVPQHVDAKLGSDWQESTAFPTNDTDLKWMESNQPPQTKDHRHWFRTLCIFCIEKKAPRKVFRLDSRLELSGRALVGTRISYV